MFPNRISRAHARAARIPCLGPLRSYTGVCWRSIPAAPMGASQTVVFIGFSKSAQCLPQVLQI